MTYRFICFKIGTGVGLGPDPENPVDKLAGAGLAGGPDS